jgi:hypothetical protein
LGRRDWFKSKSKRFAARGIVWQNIPRKICLYSSVDPYVPIGCPKRRKKEGQAHACTNRIYKHHVWKGGRIAA